MQKENIKQKKNIFGKWLFYLILLIYPLRHINWGLDLWDTGYNYANFQYMGLEHMDSMWLYSTYLANAAGNFLTKLPFAGNLAGMNFYTGLFVSGLALAGFWFCTEKLHIPMWIAFLGEMMAISLCWCPTALLYNYLTYVLLLVCVILLYLGLSRKKMWYLFGAGICLGANVLVRFSNLPEAALIVGVWAYAIIEGLEAAKAGKARQESAQPEVKPEKLTPGEVKSEQVSPIKYAWNQAWRHTLWCLGGYLAALAVLFGYIHIRYGLDNYVEGILRLFAMTDNATDYKATSMIMGLVGTYIENFYWVIRIGIIAITGVILFLLLNLLNFGKHVKAIACGIWIAISVAMLGWLYYRGFCSLQFYSYGSILRPGVLFLMLTMGIAVIRVFHPKSPKEEKLISGLMLLVVLLTSIGSNNGVYPSLNNLFIAAPYTFWECWRFFTKVKEWKWKRITISAFPVKGVLAAFLAMFVFQSAVFGASFVFVEATGAQQVTTTVDNNEILKGIRMHPDRAKWMQEISDYANRAGLKGREVILYGQVPALSYYLQMPSAFNPWSDLRSYSVSQMELDMAELTGKITEKGKELPVIITDISCMDKTDDEKWLLILEFIEKFNYNITFENEKFVIWE